MKLKKPKFWDYDKPNFLALLLWPLSIIYKVIFNLSNKKKIKINSIKTICIGNIYIGGTGKTSLAIKIKQILDQKNIRACFIKKQYADQIDEVKLLQNYGKIFVNKKRIEALKQAASENYEVAIFDDGLQDNSIEFDLIFVCFNKLNWIGNGLVIPAGPLREDINNLKLYNHVFLNGNEEKTEIEKNFIKKINPKTIIYESRYRPLNLEDFDKSEKYLVFSGIGNHKTFINMLKKKKFNILSDLEFPDHFYYKESDLNKIFLKAKKLNARIITTEKDYLRINQSLSKDIKFIKSELEIMDEDSLTRVLINNNVNH
jgi:tetraacyldisaccharide 4'-kinase